MPRVPRSTKHFPTGSEYKGTWNILGMSGFGTYTFPNKDVKYEGSFEDGMFHGEGVLKYSNGTSIRGLWEKGVLKNKILIFADGLEYSEEKWPYAKSRDRRFTIEYDNGLQPADNTYKTACPCMIIPEGYYDVGDGFYDPKTKSVYKYEDLTSIVRPVEDPCEHNWILQNCRTDPLEPIGPADIYEEWQEPALTLEKPKTVTPTHFWEEIEEEEYDST